MNLWWGRISARSQAIRIVGSVGWWVAASGLAAVVGRIVDEPHWLWGSISIVGSLLFFGLIILMGLGIRSAVVPGSAWFALAFELFLLAFQLLLLSGIFLGSFFGLVAGAGLKELWPLLFIGGFWCAGIWAMCRAMQASFFLARDMSVFD